MRIGIPKALLYYRYGVLWETFFKELGCETITSEDTNQSILTQGIENAIGEYCLPVKVYMGHIANLMERCDRILVPRFENIEKNVEFCIRFWGLPDIVRSTYPQAPIIGYNLLGHKPFNEPLGFLSMAKALGKGTSQALRAYQYALEKQANYDALLRRKQEKTLVKAEYKILLAAHSYLIHDPLVGRPLVRMLREAGGTPIYADRCDRNICRKQSKELTGDLFWHMNQEIIGAIPHMRKQTDGIILLSAFPCGTDSLVNELAMRRIKQMPVTLIVLDEQQGEAGLQTRIECFMDIIKERRRSHVS